MRLPAEPGTDRGAQDFQVRRGPITRKHRTGWERVLLEENRTPLFGAPLRLADGAVVPASTGG